MTPGGTAATWLALLAVELGPRRLWEVHRRGEPETTWDRLSRGVRADAFPSTVDQRAAWRLAAASVDPVALLTKHRAAGVEVTIADDGRHPEVAAGDPHLPPVLLWSGARGAGITGTRPAVGIVGTRRASRYGIDLAARYGAELAAAGCCVVSGLAAGIDAAAHRGALSADGAPPLAVVGSGLDRPYPRSNRQLWADVAERGAVVSEYLLGTPPAAWRFPARNRILVALCDVLVVIESHERGGSLITAGIAGARGVPVLAVPGAVHSATSRGTNRLIADGCQPCLDVEDVLDSLGLAGRLPLRQTGPRSASEAAGSDIAGMPPDADMPPAAERVLDALGWSPRTFDEVADACGDVALHELSLGLAALLAAGRLVARDGRYEQVAP